MDSSRAVSTFHIPHKNDLRVYKINLRPDIIILLEVTHIGREIIMIIENKG